MQLFYALRTDESLTQRMIQKRYWDSIDMSYEVLIYNIYIVLNIIKIAQEDFTKRNKKHLPTDADKIFTAKIYENNLIDRLIKSKELQEFFEKKEFNSSSDIDHLKTIYSDFSKSAFYIDYLAKESSDQDHVDILLELYRYCRKSELYNDIIGDKYLNWLDDKSLVIGAMKKVIKALPSSDIKFYEEFYPDDETIKEYGEELLNQTYNNDKQLLEIIKPILSNWDPDRLAILDMALLKMAACEMLNFSSIPAKVTINEYVEVAKAYSTEKSKEFVNGVLDNLMKKLQSEDKLNKKGRGLKED
ncbi:MAG: transcription antitermination factor NusB [Saprospiraceae bacterium]